MILNEQFLRKYARQEMRSSITESMKGRLHYEDAISKWECDRTHIANYRSNELETIKAESISTKSRIRR